MKDKKRQEWKARINALKKLGVVPSNWQTPNQLANFICRIDPYLITADHLSIHDLFGKRMDKEGKEIDRWIIPLHTAKRIMDSAEYEKIKEEKIDKHFGDDLKDIDRKSMIQLKRKIDEGDPNMIKVGLEMTGRWTRNIKVTRVDETKKAEQLGKLIKKYFHYEDVKGLDGNN